MRILLITIKENNLKSKKKDVLHDPENWTWKKRAIKKHS